MRNISLLPEEIRKHILISKRISIVATFSIITAVIFLFGYGATGLLTLTPLIELKSLEEQNKTVNSQIKDLKPYEDQLNALKVNVNDYKTALGNIPPVNIIIYKICDSMPNDIKLLKLDVDCSVTDSYKVIIEGIGSDISTATEWIDRLSEPEYISKVYCKSMEEYVTFDTIKTVRFLLEIPLKGVDKT